MDKVKVKMIIKVTLNLAFPQNWKKTKTKQSEKQKQKSVQLNTLQLKKEKFPFHQSKNLQTD